MRTIPRVSAMLGLVGVTAAVGASSYNPLAVPVRVTNVPTVTVANLPGEPIREVFAHAASITIPADRGDSGSLATCATVPTDRHLILELLNARINSNTRSTWVVLSVHKLQPSGGDGGLVTYPLERRTLPNFPGLGSFSMTEQTTIRVLPGWQVCFGLNRLDLTGEEDHGILRVEGILTDRM